MRRLSVLVQPFVAMFTGRPELARLYASILVSGTQSSSLFTELAARLVDEFAAAITEPIAMIDPIVYPLRDAR